MARLEQPQIAPVSQLPATPQKAMSMEQSLRAAIENDFINRQAQQEEERARIKDMLGQKTQVDLTPLMALASSISGSDAPLKGYSAPKDNGEEIAGAMRNLASGQRGLTQDRIADLKTMLQNKKDAASGKDARQQLAFTEKYRTMAYQDYGKLDAARTKVQKSLGTLTQALTPHLDSKTGKMVVNKNEVLGLLGNYVKAVGGDSGALSDGDINRALQNTYLSSISSMISKITNNPDDVNMDPETFRSLQNNIVRSMKNHNEADAEAAEGLKTKYASNPYTGVLYSEGMDLDKIHKNTTRKYNIPSFGTEDVQASAPAQILEKTRGETVNAAPRKRTVAEIQAEIDSLK